MSRALADESRLVRLPRHVTRALAKLTRAAVELRHSRGGPPTESELASNVRLPVEQVVELLTIPREPRSLESLSPDEDPSWFLAHVPDASAPDPLRAAMEGQLRVKMLQALSGLKPREERILKLHFGIGCESSHTLQQIGRMFDLSRERVRQIERAAVRKMHAALFRRTRPSPSKPPSTDQPAGRGPVARRARTRSGSSVTS